MPTTIECSGKFYVAARDDVQDSYELTRARLTNVCGQLPSCPVVWEHYNNEVYGELLGHSPEQLAALTEQGVL